MSDNSESGSDDAKYDRYSKMNGKADDICRDYLRNVCKRGKNCKYRHPNTEETQDFGKHQDLTFCHDFQNTGCRRPNCKFLHCTREEEEYQKQTGQLPVRLQQAAALGIGVAPMELPLLKGEVPICKDYLKGECKRGPKCKFRHLTSADYDYQLRKSEQRNSSSNLYDPYEDDFDRFDRYDFERGSKRRRSERDFDHSFSGFEGRYSSSRPLSYQLLEEENCLLRRKIEELKKNVSDLTATNEVLLEQNARYRVSKSNGIQTFHVPVTLTQALPTSVSAAVANSAQAPQLSHFNATLAQQIALNSELASQHALQQRIARELAAPSQATLSALSQSVTLNPSNVPVSLSQNASLATVTLQQQTLQPSVTMSQSMPQNLAAAAAASNTLVSYPMVSQSMRTLPSSLAH